MTINYPSQAWICGCHLITLLLAIESGSNLKCAAAAESNRDVAAFNANCAERQYYIDDMKSILRELGIVAN